MALRSDISVRGAFTLSGTSELVAPVYGPIVRYEKILETGTSASQNDLLFVDETKSFTGTTAQDIDLAGSLSPAIGSTLTFVEVTGMLIIVKTTTSGVTLSVGGKATNTFINWVAAANDELIVQADGCFLLTAPVDGYAVTASTGDILELTPSATLDATVVFWGRSA